MKLKRSRGSPAIMANCLLEMRRARTPIGSQEPTLSGRRLFIAVTEFDAGQILYRQCLFDFLVVLQ